MDFSEEELSEIFKTFKYETEEHIENINKHLLKLEKNPIDMGIIAELFREAHSIKGSARMLGINSIQKIAHKIEDILKMAKEETITITSDIIDVLCEGIDIISKTLQKLSVNQLDYTDKSIVDIAFKIDFIRDNLVLNEKNSKTNSNESVFHTNSENEILVNGDALTKFIKKHTSLLDNKYQKDNAINALLNLIDEELSKGLPENEKKILTEAKENLSFIKENNLLPSSEIAQSIEQALKAIGTNLSEDKINHIISKQNSVKQLLILQDESKRIFKTDPISNIDGETNKNSQTKTTPESYIENVFKTLRVDTNKLDKLEAQSEELIIQKIRNKKYIKTINELSEEITETQKALNKALNCFSGNDSEKHISEILTTLKFLKKNISYANEKLKTLQTDTDNLKQNFSSTNSKLDLLVNELETTVKSIRILPLSMILHMFPRMVRDISRNQGKQVELVITGSETGADKTIVEEIRSPLIHIINNAIDHGIETPEERIAKGKNPTGKIILNSYNLNNNIVIEISDDGKGLDVEKIKEKAIKEKILTNNELSLMNENQIFNLIFWPGFSTASKITNLSGRGVGLDVVYNSITQHDGKVSVSSKKDEGFRITITIPTAIASMQGLTVKVDNQIFAIPSANVVYVKQIQEDEIFTKEGKPHIMFLNNSVRLIKLVDILGYKAAEKAETLKKNIVIVQSEESILALEIDKILGAEEIIQKKLNPPLTRVRHISGISSLPNGESCLILNISDIIKASLTQKRLIKGQTILSLPNNQRKTSSILIVDDSYTTLILEKNILKSAGYKVITANNGIEALDKLTYESVDLIITDLEMPQMDGIELIKKIREKDTNIPIIVLTSHDEKLPHLYAQNFSNDIILKKEFNRNLFLQKIEDNLST